MGKQSFNLGQTMGLMHSQVCKEAYFTWNKNQTQENKTAMVAAKVDCPLCNFKRQLRRQEKLQKEVA